MSEHILLAYGFDGQGGAEALSGEAVSRLVEDAQLAWVHMDVDHPQTRPWLEREVSYLDPFIIDALLAEETRPRMTQIGDGVLVILRGMNLNENAAPEDMISIRLWVDAHRVISVRKRKLRAVGDIEQMLIAGNGPKDAGEFVSALASRLFGRMQPVLSELDDMTDGIEEKLLEDFDPSLREQIVSVRKKAIIFRRYIAPQRDAISQLRMAELSWMSEHDRRQLQEAFNDVIRYVEDLDAIKERAQIVKDELANMIADRLNRNTYVLSVIAAIFLPLGFLTGLFGINVGGVPGVDSNSAFMVFCIVMVLVVVVQVVVFRRLKWF